MDLANRGLCSRSAFTSDILEVALLLKEVGLLRPREGRLAVDIVPLFETIDALRNCGRVMDNLLAKPQCGGAAPTAWCGASSWSSDGTAAALSDMRPTRNPKGDR